MISTIFYGIFTPRMYSLLSLAVNPSRLHHSSQILPLSIEPLCDVTPDSQRRRPYLVNSYVSNAYVPSTPRPVYIQSGHREASTKIHRTLLIGNERASDHIRSHSQWIPSTMRMVQTYVVTATPNPCRHAVSICVTQQQFRRILD
jgi:hypothetical protein